jgi:hypothetical protein
MVRCSTATLRAQVIIDANAPNRRDQPAVSFRIRSRRTLPAEESGEEPGTAVRVSQHLA